MTSLCDARKLELPNAKRKRKWCKERKERKKKINKEREDREKRRDEREKRKEVVCCGVRVVGWSAGG